MKKDELLELLIDEDIYDFRCFDLLKERLKNDKEFRLIVLKGVKEGKVSKFPRDIFDKFCTLNLRMSHDTIDFFKDGINIGNCTNTSIIVSFTMFNPVICGGTLKTLVGSTNSIDGSHTWIENKDKIIDTSLMLEIDKKYSNEFGYIEENRYSPYKKQGYASARDFALDTNLKRR